MEESRNEEAIRREVQKHYEEVAKKGKPCCGDTTAQVSPCCGDAASGVGASVEKRGYTEEELSAIPQGANLGLGCGNPVALASLKEGELVLDLGAGAGVDVFLASKAVGDRGKVIGVDMTEEMVSKARENAQKGGFKNVEFRLGNIEELPLESSSVDVVISNCVINLSPDKVRVFREAHRVLRPGGRLMVSDIVLEQELPGWLRESMEAYVGCLAGALKREEYLGAIEAAGFSDVRVVSSVGLSPDIAWTDPLLKRLGEKVCASGRQLEEALSTVRSVAVSARK